jgi:hypothetical protein
MFARSSCCARCCCSLLPFTVLLARARACARAVARWPNELLACLVAGTCCRALPPIGYHQSLGLDLSGVLPCCCITRARARIMCCALVCSARAARASRISQSSQVQRKPNNILSLRALLLRAVAVLFARAFCCAHVCARTVSARARACARLLARWHSSWWAQIRCCAHAPPVRSHISPPKISVYLAYTLSVAYAHQCCVRAVRTLLRTYARAVGLGFSQVLMSGVRARAVAVRTLLRTHARCAHAYARTPVQISCFLPRCILSVLLVVDDLCYMCPHHGDGLDRSGWP